jgi:hypothetical protein
VRFTFALSSIGFLLVLLSGCENVPTVPTPPPGTRDATPPLLRLGSAGLSTDFIVTQDSTAPQERRARTADDLLFVATAEDPDTGIASVTLDVTLAITCGQSGTNQTFSMTQPANSGAGTLPQRLSQEYQFNVGAHKARCRSHPSHLTVSLRASAQNGAGATRNIQPAHVAAIGPERLRVATFNTHGGGRASPIPDSDLQRWGGTFGTLVDILIFTEITNTREAAFIANAAGLPFFQLMNRQDVLIASRTPLYGDQHLVHSPVNAGPAADSKILSVFTDIDGLKHQVIGAHWGIRDANDFLPGPHVSAPGRQQAANLMISLISPTVAPVFAGGDMNAYSGFGRQNHDGLEATPDFVGMTNEVAFLRTRFTDPFISMNIGDGVHCSDQRIDYVMFSGPYVPTRYQACFVAEALPSDHPFVVVTFEPGGF